MMRRVSLDLVPASVEDFRDLAHRRLPRALFDYVDGGAGLETTLVANQSAWAGIRLRQRVLRDVSDIQTGIDLLGERLAIPVILAPVGMAGLMAQRAEVQAKRAADRCGIPFTLSTVSICPIEEVAQDSPRPLWFQLYMLRDRGVVEDMLARAWQNGVRKLVFTVDLNVLGTRYRDIRNGMAGGASIGGRLRAGLIDYVMHPRWLSKVVLGGRPLVFGNIARHAPTARALRDFKQWIDEQLDDSVDWNDIAWLRDRWQGDLILKGILDPDDARQACDMGADAIVVSNHGGRQLDGVSPTADMLPRIADTIGTAVPLIVDGAIRTGQDVVRALALGAAAVMIGRPWVHALAAGGETGLERLLSLIAEDLRTALGLTGYCHASALDRDALDERSG